MGRLSYLEIIDLFIKASRLTDDDLMGLSYTNARKRKLREAGIRFKRKAVGFCGKETLKTLEELSQVVYDTGLASSEHEARELIQHFLWHRIVYDYNAALKLSSTRDSSGNRVYRVRKLTWSDAEADFYPIV